MFILTADLPPVEEDLREIEREGNRADELGDCPYLDEGPVRDAWMRGFNSPRNHECHPHEEFHRGI
jgi:hypothetical protein